MDPTGPPDQEAAFSQLDRRLRPPEQPGKGALRALRTVLAVSAPVTSIVLAVELTVLSTSGRAPWLLVVMAGAILAAWVRIAVPAELRRPAVLVLSGEPVVHHVHVHLARRRRSDRRRDIALAAADGALAAPNECGRNAPA